MHVRNPLDREIARLAVPALGALLAECDPAERLVVVEDRGRVGRQLDGDAPAHLRQGAVRLDQQAAERERRTAERAEEK